MTFSVNAITDVTVVIKVGECLDSRTATEFRKVSWDQIRSGMRNIVLDFTNTGSVDSTGLGSLYTLYRDISAVGGKVLRRVFIRLRVENFCYDSHVPRIPIVYFGRRCMPCN